MRYLSRFYFATEEAEYEFMDKQKLRCYDSYYPYGILPKKRLETLDPAEVTILYGSNGSGKTTLLNIMAEKLGAKRTAAFNRSPFFERYLADCDFEKDREPAVCQIITSDDVFDYMLDVRMLNEGIDAKREERFQDFYKYQKTPKHFSSINDLEEVRASQLANSKTLSQYVRRTLPDNVREYSNGESGYRYFVNNIQDNGLYFLDEPENSLAPARQADLAQFLEEAARFYGCQLIIATHSPFLLAIPGARVFDMDSEPVRERDWHRLDGILQYYRFFASRAEDFRKAEEEARQEKEAAEAALRENKNAGLSSARARLASQLRERRVSEKDIQALLGLMQEDAQAGALVHFLLPMNPDRFRTEKAQKELRMSLFEEAMRIYQEDKD